MKRPILVMLSSIILTAACSQKPAVEPATLVLKGGKIVTVDAAKPEAQAIAIRGDKIAALGTNEEIAGLRRARARRSSTSRARPRCPASSRATATSPASAARA